MCPCDKICYSYYIYYIFGNVCMYVCYRRLRHWSGGHEIWHRGVVPPRKCRSLGTHPSWTLRVCSRGQWANQIETWQKSVWKGPEGCLGPWAPCPGSRGWARVLLEVNGCPTIAFLDKVQRTKVARHQTYSRGDKVGNFTQVSNNLAMYVCVWAFMCVCWL